LEVKNWSTQKNNCSSSSGVVAGSNFPSPKIFRLSGIFFFVGTISSRNSKFGLKPPFLEI